MVRLVNVTITSLLGAATVLSLLVSISLPTLSALDIARAHFGTQNSVKGFSISETRLGVWTVCNYVIGGGRQCEPAANGYTAVYLNPQTQAIATIGPSWSRGLAIHPVATAVTFIALVLSFTNLATSFALLVANSVAVFLAFLAFIVDIALYAFFHSKLSDAGFSRGISTGPGFWLSFITVVLLILSEIWYFRMRRSDQGSGSEFPLSDKLPFVSRFRN